ncbi:hypothetical protein PR048_001579 [Dryococelus australis]|uniref:MADF domain-containing protein n=1 Tax=Dryococelus australis TaxID=614101 RepID=A0ABQ9IHW3_9NEOP|nr:hypothetical protein PR048_001579 [Dryococelus australis]
MLAHGRLWRVPATSGDHRVAYNLAHEPLLVACDSDYCRQSLPARCVYTMASFDSDRFIIEVESRPAIWDTRSDTYGNKLARGKAWE